MKNLRGGFRMLALMLVLSVAHAVGAQDISTALMNATFEIEGSTKGGGSSSGTVLIMGRPLKENPQRGAYVLITAAHVLDGINEDEATLVLRRKTLDGSYVPVPLVIKLRAFGVPLYKKHPTADVAAMYVNIPAAVRIDLLPTTALVDDKQLTDIELHPGDELLCLGFPLRVDFNTFPVIRSGLLASYPLTPTREIGTFYYNFHTFPGNSGGPVYYSFISRQYQGATHLGNTLQGVIGLVSQQVSSTLPGYESAQMDIAKIVPSSFILDTIALLPEASTRTSPSSFEYHPDKDAKR